MGTSTSQIEDLSTIQYSHRNTSQGLELKTSATDAHLTENRQNKYMPPKVEQFRLTAILCNSVFKC